MKTSKVQVDLINIDHPRIKPLYDIYKRALTSKHAAKAISFAQTIINVSRMLRLDKRISVTPIVKRSLEQNCECLADSAFAINDDTWLKIITELAKEATKKKSAKIA